MTYNSNSHLNDEVDELVTYVEQMKLLLDMDKDDEMQLLLDTFSKIDTHNENMERNNGNSKDNRNNAPSQTDLEDKTSKTRSINTLKEKVKQFSSIFQDETENVHKEFLSSYIELSPELQVFSSNFEDVMSILNSAESLLMSFKDKLHSISGDINFLRDKSFGIRREIIDKRNLEKELIQWVSNCLIDADEVKLVFEGEINDKWIQTLYHLETKYNSLLKWHNSLEDGDSSMMAESDSESISSQCTTNSTVTQDGKPRNFRLFHISQGHFQILFKKASSRIRRFLLERILKITSTATSNPEYTKINILLKNRALFHFLIERESALAAEIQQTYVSVIQRYYLDSFMQYIQNLQKLQIKGQNIPFLVRPSREGLINQKPGSWSLFSNSALNLINRSTYASGNNRYDVNTLKKMLDDIRGKNPSTSNLGHPIVCHIAVAQKDQLKYEDIFRSVLILLLDTCSSESVFCAEFFKDTKMFDSIFRTSIQYIEDQFISPYLVETMEPISIQLILHYIDIARQIMLERQVSHLDDVLERINIRFIMKFKEVFDLNIKSLQEPITVSEIDTEIKDLTITKRFLNFSIIGQILLQENVESPNQHLMKSNLNQLQQAFIKLLFQIGFNIEKRYDCKKRLKFLIQAIDYILTEYMEHGIECDDGKDLSIHLQNFVTEFLDYEAKDQFPYLLSILEDYEPLANKQDTEIENRPKIDVGRFSKVANRFNLEWQSGVEMVANDIQVQFRDLESLRADIHKQFVIHTFKIYNRFRELSFLCFQNPPFRSDLIAPEKFMRALGLR